MTMHTSQLTGTLILNKVTSVILALFGPFNLNEHYPSPSTPYIAFNSTSDSYTWATLLENLQCLAISLELKIPEDGGDITEELTKAVALLAAHFNSGQSVALKDIVHQSWIRDYDVTLPALFEIAKVLDDGHGLTGYKIESVDYADKPKLFEFGGAATYVGKHFYVGVSTSGILKLGEALEKALSEQDLEKATQLLCEQSTILLEGIHDKRTRAIVKGRLAQLIAYQGPEEIDLVLGM